ncbi:CinA family nicotinamide mononucleotide deamidase-related protein [Marinithermus hydrothermalis]|uniref:CinA-like protein n=1 Tax=Marinithermus hydrothermalis (strain DSM 14884 / JCM 11576 / T1) TaxID=869210 RepID=F2NPY8_MARHT|nr:CinA family nicotinamide mononucleotide deamidase-related protein [Marinithermus hydrothermalis]AEB11089.1 competence/damage-inducible protein CinA [Marinithermus hydrothermalis DSM 14884]
MLIAEIIGVGSELIRGDTLDTNTAEIARSLEAYAVRVDRTLRVADDLQALAEAVREAWRRADLVVLSGGLGPTPDDLTREAIAQALGEPLELDAAMLERIRAFFAARGRAMPEGNQKQALRIPSARWLENPRGTAPGWWVIREAKQLVALPGPPAEWRPIWAELLPQLGLPPAPRVRKVYKTWGLGESTLVQRLGPLARRGDPALGTYAHPDGVHVVIEGTDPAATRALARSVRARLEAYIWGEDDATLAQTLLRRLEARGGTLAVMESLTGGLVTSLLTDVPGASRVVLGGVVSYSAGAKARFGVPEAVLEAHGTVSAEAARAMAGAVRALFGATHGIATTGVAGPQPLEGHPVGTVYVGVAGPDGSAARAYRFPPVGREAIKLRAAYAALAYFWSQT